MTVRIAAPARAPRRGGILAVLAATSPQDPHFAAGTHYELGPEGPAGYAPGLCDSSVVAANPMVTDEPSSVTGEVFSVYHGIKCKIQDAALYDTYARTALAQGESFAVEAAVQTLFLNAAGAVDLTPTPGTAVGRYLALALLEQHLAVNYGATGLLHTNRFGAAYLSADMVEDSGGGLLVTKQGTPVVNGAGYGAAGIGAVTAAADEFWVYASGLVGLQADPVASHGHPVFIDNDFLVYAERTYVASVEGPRVGVLCDGSAA